MFISLSLFHVARLSFRAVSRTLAVLADFLGLEKVPCPQTIINYVNRLTIARIRNAARSLNVSSIRAGYIWIVDISIATGAGKCLPILALRADHYHVKGKAPTLRDVFCVAIKVSESWTGDNVADFLSKVIATVGPPVAIVKDGGSNLAKGNRLLAESGFYIPAIDDVSHVTANILKREYADHPMFQTFITACGKASKKLKQTLLACLAPPKVSTKARFMNLHRLVRWSSHILSHSPRGRAAEGSMLQKLRDSIGELPGCKAFVERFLRDATPLLEAQKILKNKGLSHQTVKACEVVIDQALPPNSYVRITFTNWMRNQLKIAEQLKLAEVGMPVTSDTIESLFGVGKVHGAGVVKDANRLAARLPAMCGKLTKDEAKAVLGVSIKDQNKVMGDLKSLIKERRDVLPNPGSLETLAAPDARSNLELIPKVEKCAKNAKNIILSAGCAEAQGPEKKKRRSVCLPWKQHDSTSYINVDRGCI